MSRIILVAMMLAVAIAGCDRFPDLTIQVTANLAPDDGSCSVTADQEETLARGIWDVSYVSGYAIWTRIESYLVDNLLETQASSRNIQITGYDVTIKLPDNTILDLGESLPNPYTVTSSAVIPASPAIGSVSTGSALAIGVPSTYQSAVAQAAAAAGFDSIVIDIRANGTTSGGFSQQSPPFSWPIELCAGCMAATCAPPAEVGDGLGCFPGQDGWAYCGEIVDPEPTP